MNVIEWVFSIKNRIVWIVGSNSLSDLRLAINGYMEAIRYNSGYYYNPFFPGFQRYVEGIYNRHATTKSWAEIITEASIDEKTALNTFYKLLFDYQKTLNDSN